MAVEGFGMPTTNSHHVMSTVTVNGKPVTNNGSTNNTTSNNSCNNTCTNSGNNNSNRKKKRIRKKKGDGESDQDHDGNNSNQKNSSPNDPDGNDKEEGLVHDEEEDTNNITDLAVLQSENNRVPIRPNLVASARNPSRCSTIAALAFNTYNYNNVSNSYSITNNNYSINCSNSNLNTVKFPNGYAQMVDRLLYWAL